MRHLHEITARRSSFVLLTTRDQGNWNWNWVDSVEGDFWWEKRFSIQKKMCEEDKASIIYVAMLFSQEKKLNRENKQK